LVLAFVLDGNLIATLAGDEIVTVVDSTPEHPEIQAIIFPSNGKQSKISENI
jgi:hypothetical protein